MRSFVLCAVWAALAGTSWGQIDVPGDYPDPQTAVDNASPGDVIVVHGGTWTSTGPEPALVIDRPLTLIGDPAPTFRPPMEGLGQQPPAVRLAGPGSGTVVLAHVNIDGATSGFLWSFQTGGLAGDGFAEVHVYDSSIAAPVWTTLTGIADGASGIDVDTPFLLLSNSIVRASDGADDGCYNLALDGHAGVRSTGIVLALDSTITGGTYRQPCFSSPECGPTTGGAGGPGVEAPRVDEAASTITGGPGAVWSNILGMPCGSAAAGPSVLATTHVRLADDLAVARPTRVGGSIALSWSTAGRVVQLYSSLGPSAPRTFRPRLPEFYLDPASTQRLGVFRGGVGSTEIAVPPLSSLVGRELSFQAIAPPAHVTRPVSVILAP